jgi:hypothetical protein
MDVRNLFTSLGEIQYEALCDFYPANSGVRPTFKQVIHSNTQQSDSLQVTSFISFDAL